MDNQNCHTIPQFILRNFATDNGKGKVCVYRKDKQKPVRTGVKAVFAEKNLYHAFELDYKLNHTGEHSNEVEQELAKLEGRVAKVCKKIQTTRNEGEHLSLDEQEKYDLFRFFRSMCGRSPRYIQEWLKTEAPNEHKIFKEIIKQLGQAVDTSNKKLLSDSVRIGQLSLIREALNHPVPARISTFRFSIKSSTEPKLVIGDYPLANIDKANWFPISPQIAVSGKGYGCEEELDNDFAAEFNAKIFTKSEQVAALCKKQLTALIDQDKKDC